MPKTPSVTACAAALLAVGCPDSPPKAQGPSSAAQGSGASSERAPSTAPAPSAEADPQTTPDPKASQDESQGGPGLDAAFFRSIATGERPLEHFVDAERGLVVVEHYSDASGEDPRADDDGVVRFAERLCGAQLRARLDALERDLRLRAERSARDPVFRCDALTCRHPAEMEYDRAGTYRFTRRPDGTLRLRSVVRIEGGPVTEELLERAEAWAREHRRRLEGGDGCS